MTSAFTSRLAGIDRSRRSPNFNDRAAGFARPDCLVLHYTGMKDGPSAIARLCDPASEVSSHYVVTESGDLLQLVDEEHRAWCCGRAFWRGRTDLNSASVNIEIVNGGHDYGLPPYPDRQIAALIRLCADILARHAIPPDRVLAHSDIAPGRKRDPGEHFPWHRLAAAGIGVWVDVGDGERASAASGIGRSEDVFVDLEAYGYGLPGRAWSDDALATVVEAFQRHFRPSRIDGVADVETRAILRALLALRSPTMNPAEAGQLF